MTFSLAVTVMSSNQYGPWVCGVDFATVWKHEEKPSLSQQVRHLRVVSTFTE